MGAKKEFRAAVILPTAILTSRGFLFFGLILIGPMGAFLFRLAPQQGIILSLGVFLFYIVLSFIEFQKIRRYSKGISFKGKIPAALYSGVSSVLILEGEFPQCGEDLELFLRPQLLFGILPDNEIIKYRLLSGETSFGVEYRFSPLRRGDLRWKELACRIVFPLKLFSWQVTINFENDVCTRVYPNPFSTRKPQAIVFQKTLLGSTPFDYAGGGEGREFDSLRPYSQGDDLRRVDWKRTAKRNSLLVKVYRPETHQRVLFVFDCSRRMGVRIGERLQLDYAADGAAHLLGITSQNDDEVGLFAFDHQALSEIPARRGKAQRKLLMDEMANLSVGSLEGDYELVGSWARRCKRRSMIILLTSISSPASVDVIKNVLSSISQKHLPLVIAIYDRQLQALAEKKVENLNEAYIQAASFEQIETIQSRMNILRRGGIECVYSDVLDIPDVLREKYYQVKLSGRL